MPTMVIRIEPGKLQNPDLDLRYEIPDLLKERSNGSITDAGYDYDQNKAMMIFLSTQSLSTSLTIVLSLIEKEEILENRLAGLAVVGVADGEAADVREFRIVYPETATGVLTVPD